MSVSPTRFPTPSPEGPSSRDWLVVEDDPRIALLLRERLRQAGLQPHVVANVVNAIRFLAKRDHYVMAPTPAQVLVELHLPVFSGLALLEERRRRPSWSDIRFVMLVDSPDQRLACVARGADGVLLKPKESHGWQRTVDDLLVRYATAGTGS